jgi:hypothetical protein
VVNPATGDKCDSKCSRVQRVHPFLFLKLNVPANKEPLGCKVDLHPVVIGFSLSAIFSDGRTHLDAMQKSSFLKV